MHDFHLSTRYLDGSGEPGAEGAEDAEAVVQSERSVVLTEEVDQLAAFLLQLLPAAAQRAKTRGGRLKSQSRKVVSDKNHKAMEDTSH